MDTTLDLDTLTRLHEQVAPQSSLAELMGTLTALVTAPSAEHPSTWLLWLTDEARFDDEDDARAFLQQALALYQQIDGQFQLGETLGPDRKDMTAVAQWSRGYFATARRDPLWAQDTAAMRRLMPLALLAGELDRVGDPDAVMHGDAMRGKWASNIPQLAAAFYEHWQELRTRNRSSS